jgi:hypothetical protein
MNKLRSLGRTGFQKWERTFEFGVKVSNWNYDQEVEEDGYSYKQTANVKDIGFIYDRQMKEMLKHLWKHEEVIQDTVSELMFDEVNDGLPIGSDYVMTFVLNNQDVIAPLVQETLLEASSLYENEREKNPFNYVPPVKYEFIRDPKKTEEKTTVKCLYAPYYLDNEVKRSDTEDQFSDWLEQHSNVLWWLKNYDRKYEESYSVIYEGVDKEKAFFPDFIGQTRDGRTFVLEVKKGDLDRETNNKRDALIAALGDNVICGIVRLDTGWWYLDRNKGKERLDDLLK